MESKDKKATNEKIKAILEKYERRYDFHFSVVGYKGLLVSDGFLQQYLDEEIVAAQGGALLDLIKIFVEKVLGEPHVPEDSSLRQHMDVSKLPQRKIELKNMTMELLVENYAVKKMERYDIILSPLSIENAFLLLILDKRSSRTIKLDLDQEQREIETVLNHYYKK